MNYRRWLIVAYMLLLMAFTISVLLVPGEKYDTLTTSDSGWVYDIAVEMDRTNTLVENNPLSHAPDGQGVSLNDQAQPLFAVMMYRGASAVNPSVTLEDVVKYYAPIMFALSLIPIFLMGRELAGDMGGIAAAFFAATLTSTIYWNKIGAFDREPTQLLLGAWAMYLTIKLFKAPKASIPKFALLAGLVYGLFGLAWSGWHYLIAIVTLGLLFVLAAGFFGKLFRKISDVFGALFHGIRSHLDLIAGMLGMMAVITIVLCALGGGSPLMWPGIFQSYAGYILPGGAGGVGWSAPASEARAPEDWGETLGRLYNYQGGAEILTTVILILIAIALAKFLWSRKRWEWLVLAWLLVLVTMVWPEKGQIRFERLWWPMIPVLAGVGMATLVHLIRRFSFEPSGEWLKHLLNPLALVLVACIIAVPFAYNAYVVAEQTGPPTGGLDPGYIEAFTWLRENTPEDSVAAIQWSYGHLLTGVSRRPAVTDGADPDGEEGVWESDPTFTPRPPDYIWYKEGGQTQGYGVDVSRKQYAINGRRVDVEWFPIASENEFRWYMTAYRDNYNCKIEYVIFSAREYYGALDYYLLYNERAYYGWGYGFQAENILLGAKEIKALSQPVPTVEGQTYTFDFGENREAVVLDTGTYSAYLKADGETSYLDGYGVLTALRGGSQIYYGMSVQHIVSFYQPSSTPDIQETLLIYVDERGTLSKASLVEGISAEVSGRPLPMAVRAYWGAIADIDYLQVPFTSSDGIVKVLQISHVPTLTSPENNAQINDNTPEFAWKGAVGATGYELQIGNAQDFATVVYSELNMAGTTRILPDENALEPGTWYWRVGAYNSENNLLGWSEDFTFTLDIQAPDQPQLSEPQDNAELSALEVSFSWTEEPGVKYDIQIDNEQDFDNIYYVYETTGLTDNSHSYTFLRNGEYYWRVRAVDAAGNPSEWSDNFTLTIRAPPQAPTLSLPENEAITNENTLVLQWTGGNGDNYRLILDNDTDFSSPNVDEILAPSDTSYTIAGENALSDGIYSWKVIAIVGSEENFEVWTFTVDTTPPEAPALSVPENENQTSNATPTFEWRASPDADNHRLIVDNNSDFGSPVLDNTFGPTDNTHTPTDNLAPDMYWWKVIALDNAGNENHSAAWLITVTAPEE